MYKHVNTQITAHFTYIHVLIHTLTSTTPAILWATLIAVGRNAERERRFSDWIWNCRQRESRIIGLDLKAVRVQECLM